MLRVCRAGLILALLGAAARLRADDTPPAPDAMDGAQVAAHEADDKSTTPKATDDDLRIRGVFNSVLPGTEKKNSLRLIFHPHIGDLLEKDYLSVPIGLRYGLTRRAELSGTVEGYFSHGLGSVPFFDESGFSAAHLGTKIRVAEGLVPGWDFSTGLDWTRPIGTPPKDVTDGMQHIAPFLSGSHPLEGMPHTRVFGSITYDDVTPLGIDGELEPNELSDDSLELAIGFVHQHRDISYTFEVAYATTHFTGRVDEDAVAIRPGIVWVMPDRYTFWAKGKWLLGVSLRAGYGPDGFDVGGGAKLRMSFDLKRLIGRHPPAPKP